MDSFIVLHENVGRFSLLMQAPSEDYTVTVVNRMFVEAGFKIDKTFRKISETTLNVSVRAVNFTDGQNASEAIKSWVRERTNRKINELFTPGESTGGHFYRFLSRIGTN